MPFNSNIGVGVGIVSFEDESDVSVALQMFDGFVWYDSKLHVGANRESFQSLLDDAGYVGNFGKTYNKVHDNTSQYQNNQNFGYGAYNQRENSGTSRNAGIDDGYGGYGSFGYGSAQQYSIGIIIV